MRRVEWFIARRYIFSRERKLLFSAITLISIAGVTLGVAALIIVLGVMDGADTLIYGKIADLSPHVRIRHADNEPFTPDAALLEKLRKNPDVLFAEPLINRLTLIQSPARQGGEVVELIGQDEVGPGRLFSIPNRQTQRPIPIAPDEVLLGAPIFLNLELTPGMGGQQVQIVSTQPIQTAVGPQSKILPVNVLGYFSTGFGELDSVTAFTSEQTIRELYRLPRGFDYIHIKLKDPWQAKAMGESLKAQLPPEYTVSTWAEENSKFFSALTLEKFGMFITMLLVVLVAAFNIIGTLILMALEKTREVGILRAMGASPAMITRIFLLDGVLIGIVGTGLGTLIGLAGLKGIPEIKLNLQAVVFLDHIPVTTRPATVLIIVAVSLLICTLAAVFPARQAARLNPIEALKFD
jgi:lipoprotein-releasing system permease protein